MMEGVSYNIFLRTFVNVTYRIFYVISMLTLDLNTKTMEKM
jgi:hypothetical protein